MLVKITVGPCIKVIRICKIAFLMIIDLYNFIF